MTGQANRVANWQQSKSNEKSYELKKKIVRILNSKYNGPNFDMIVEEFLDPKLVRSSQIVLLNLYEPYFGGIKNVLYPYIH